MSLHLLDHRGRFVAGRQRFGGSVNDYVALLLLFDGYKGEGSRRVLDRQYFVQTLMHTFPFGIQHLRGRDRRAKGGLLVFTARVPPASGSQYRFSPGCDPDGMPTLDESTLESFIEGLRYYDFVDGRATWLDPDSRSYGMVGVVINGFAGRNAFYRASVRHFVVTGTRRDEMARVLLHELGHAFELEDEYEDSDWSCEGTSSIRFPNVVSRKVIEPSPHPPGTISLNPGDVLVEKVPWGRFMQSPPMVVDHPKRRKWHESGGGFTDCVVGDYVNASPNGPGSSFAALWEGGYRHSFNTFRAEPACIMRDHWSRYHEDVAHPSEVPYVLEVDGIVIDLSKLEQEAEEMLPPDPPTVADSPFCGLALRDSSEPTRFTEQDGDSFVVYCMACRHWIEYRFGLPNQSHSDPHDWAPSGSLEDRLDNYQSWLSSHR